MNGFEKFADAARRATIVPVVETMPADLLTPLAVYLRLSKGRADSFLLESVTGGETLARYSFVGAGSCFTLSGNSRQVTIRDNSGERVVERSAIDFLRSHFLENRLEESDDLPIFAGGAIGWLTFGCSAWFEPCLAAKFPATDEEAFFMFCRTVVAFDHARQEIKIVSLVSIEAARSSMADLRKDYDQAVAANKDIRKKIETGPIELPVQGPKVDEAVRVSNFSKEDFERAAASIKELISAGDAYQVVLSQCFSQPTSADPVSLYRAMRSLNPSPYMFLINIDGRSLIGASPEMLVRCRGRRLEYRPIAGTRPRGKTPQDDARLAEEMAADEKEVAEHLMLVDLGRNDLGRVAEYGSVEVSGLMSVEKYSHVQHLVTHLSANLRNGLDRFDALAACFPAGTVSGAPKVRAIEIINELEPTPRGIYSGTVGYFDYSGNMDTCIAIRTIELSDGLAKVQAGAGIVADSDPAAEYQETINKASALFRSIEIAEGQSDQR
ncbi:MAG TPA: anthranilate synthase component I family protein [Pyrinomonadaceae bacterium]|nr:anthranilate synthase component I family protein [Pyrinomonadaceae bacterium]